MTPGLDELCRAGAKLLTSVATAIDSYTSLQERRFEHVVKLSQQEPEKTEVPFEQFQPGHFEEQYRSQLRRGGS
jgi:hypothetical protein